MCSASRVHLPSLSPGQETCAVMEVHTPHSPGQHQCMWRATLPGGALFGGMAINLPVVVGWCGKTQSFQSVLCELNDNRDLTFPRNIRNGRNKQTSKLVPLTATWARQLKYPLFNSQVYIGKV